MLEGNIGHSTPVSRFFKKLCFLHLKSSSFFPFFFFFSVCLRPLFPLRHRYFDRDVTCIREFFARKFAFEPAHWPTLDDVTRQDTLDIAVAASGFNADLQKEFDDTLGTELVDRAADDSDEAASARRAERGQQHLADDGTDEEQDSDTELELRALEAEQDGADTEASGPGRPELSADSSVEACSSAIGVQKPTVEEKVEEVDHTLESTSLHAAGPNSGNTDSGQTSQTVTGEKKDNAAEDEEEADDDEEEEDVDELLETSEVLANREQLAFRNRDLAEPEAAKAARERTTSTKSNMSTATTRSRGPVDPNLVRQRVAAQLQRRARQANQGKAKRNRNKDPSVREARFAASDFTLE